jgi:methyltransferase (TIGR00027 family)
MKPNQPSRTALLIARQRAAHQLLDHGSVLNDPFAMKILHEDEKDVLQFANEHPLASIGRLFTTERSRIAEDALSGVVERGIRQIVILGAGLDTFALRSPHGERIRIYEVDHPATQALHPFWGINFRVRGDPGGTPEFAFQALDSHLGDLA